MNDSTSVDEFDGFDKFVKEKLEVRLLEKVVVVKVLDEVALLQVFENNANRVIVVDYFQQLNDVAVISYFFEYLNFVPDVDEILELIQLVFVDDLYHHFLLREDMFCHPHLPLLGVDQQLELLVKLDALGDLLVVFHAFHNCLNYFLLLRAVFVLLFQKQIHLIHISPFFVAFDPTPIQFVIYAQFWIRLLLFFERPIISSLFRT